MISLFVGHKNDRKDLTTFVWKTATLALEMHLYTYPRYSRNNSHLDRNEEQAITNMEEKLQFSGNLRSLKKKEIRNEKLYTSEPGSGVVVIRLPLHFFFIFLCSPCNGNRFALCRYTKHVLSPTISSLYIFVRCIF